tara:strand:- start:1788 stop:2030 length:243 start_codon:yes stop_codon:yes gene_type:complete
MVELQEILRLINKSKHRLLSVAEAALPQDQFNGFRKFTLEELGDCGLEGDLKALFRDSKREGQDWNGLGRTDTGRKGGAP